MLTPEMRQALRGLRLGPLIEHCLELPDQIEQATMRLAQHQAGLANAKADLKRREAALTSGEEKPNGQALTGTVDQKKAQIYQLTEPERNRIAVREEDVAEAARELERLQTQLNAHRAASRYAFACAGSQLGT